MRVIWALSAWNDYVTWQAADPEIVRKIDHLLEDVGRDQFSGLGKPEPLKGSFTGFWSRRVNDGHRLIYRVTGAGIDKQIEIAQCRHHYEKG